MKTSANERATELCKRILALLECGQLSAAHERAIWQQVVGLDVDAMEYAVSQKINNTQE